VVAERRDGGFLVFDTLTNQSFVCDKIATSSDPSKINVMPFKEYCSQQVKVKLDKQIFSVLMRFINECFVDHFSEYNENHKITWTVYRNQYDDVTFVTHSGRYEEVLQALNASKKLRSLLKGSVFLLRIDNKPFQMIHMKNKIEK